MIKQIINVNNKWKVIVYYDIDYNLFPYIAQELYKARVPKEEIEKVYDKMYSRKAKAFTLSNLKTKTSIVGFNVHKDRNDYINSIVHEAEHVKQAMLEYYDVEDRDEPPAYTIGFLVMKMLQVFDNL